MGGNSLGNFFKGAGAVAGNVAGLPGLLVGQMGGKGLGDMFHLNNTSDAPAPPGEDPRITQIRKENQSLADQFRSGQTATKNSLYGSAQHLADDNLKQGLKNADEGYNRRGLTYSGMHSGAENKARVQAATDLAGARQNINQQVKNQQMSLDRQALTADLGQYQTTAQIQDQVYSQALSNLMSRQASLSGLGSGLGSVVGTMKAGST